MYGKYIYYYYYFVHVGPLNVPPGTSSSTSSSSLPDDGLSICVKAVFTSSSDTRITGKL